MKYRSVTVASILFLIGFSSCLHAQQSENKSIIIDGKKVDYKTFNIRHRREGEPILVFESGLGGGTFDPILPFLPSNISGIQYERSCVEDSTSTPSVISDTELVQRLHRLLTNLDIKPPYLLVGHSIGGPYIRLFAAQFPDEVSGLVFSDPTDFMLTTAENEAARVQSGSKTGYKELFGIIVNRMAENKDFSLSTRNDASRALKAGYFGEYSHLPKLRSNIAVTVIISYNKNIELPDIEMNEKLNLGINFKPWWKEYDSLRIQHYSDLIQDNNKSMIVLLPKYSHGIYYQNPELVAKLIIDNFNSFNKE